MRVIAIDQSLTDSGYAISIYGGDVTSGHFKPTKKGVYRLDEIRNFFEGTIRKLSIDFLIFEDYAFGAKGHVFHLGELGGVLKLMCFDNNVPFMQMPIGTHKKFTTGKGNTKKDLMIKEVFKKYNLDVDNDNEADAISILMTFLSFLKYENGSEDFTKTEIDAIIKVRDIFLPLQDSNPLLRKRSKDT